MLIIVIIIICILQLLFLSALHIDMNPAHKSSPWVQSTE